MFPFVATTTDQTPTPGASLDLDLRPLCWVKDDARQIADRVRGSLTPAGAQVVPLRVLVAVGDTDAADALTVVLELLGCPVRVCRDKPSALAIASEFHPQLCLLDLATPAVDGFELATRLRAQAPGRALIVVALTPAADVAARTRAAQAGFHCQLAAPESVSSLVAALTRLGQLLVRPGIDPRQGSGASG